MAFDVAAFRVAFPEFANTTAYPTPQIEFWAGIAALQVRPEAWKSATTFGISLYTAHEITLAAQDAKAAAAGGVPGVSGGIANSKTVGSVSVSYDTTSTAEKDAGWWNSTNYGKQFYRLMRIYGSGCRQL